MDYARYTKEALDALPAGSPELTRRLTELQLEVREELHSAIRAKFADIAQRLNSLGHDLRETARPEARPSEIDYCEGGLKVGCDFYICCDAVVSAGYRGSAACHASSEEQLRWEQAWARRARATNSCAECDSDFFVDSSRMSSLCPECAHLIYGYPPCRHTFVAGRCSKCY